VGILRAPVISISVGDFVLLDRGFLEELIESGKNGKTLDNFL